MRIILFTFLFALTGCPKQKETKTLDEIERERALQELMNIDEDEFIDDLPESEEDE
tara:strand:+ start:58 stop:225 length:168 start_codon:yes stop_codon:yes gene_type:complete